MKRLIVSLILVSLISVSIARAQTEEGEIRTLITRAPVVEAAAKAEEMDILVVWNWLMALAYTGHTKEAFATAAKIRKWMGRKDSNSAIAMGLAIVGKTDEALSISRGINDPEFQALSIAILANAGRLTEALNEARKAEDEDERDEYFQLITQELAIRGEITQALEVGAKIKEKEGLNKALNGAVTALVKSRKIIEAKSLAEKIHPEGKYWSLTSAIINAVSDMVGGLQENALAMVDLIEDEADRSWPLSLIADSFTDDGKLDKALETARKIKDESLLSTTLAKVDAAKEIISAPEGSGGIEPAGRYSVERLLKASKIEEATTFAQNIKDESDRSEPLDEIAGFLLRSGSYKQARFIADQIPSPISQLSLYLDILNELAFKRSPQLRLQIKTVRFGIDQ